MEIERLHETAGIYIIVVKHVADLVVSPLSDRKTAVPVGSIVAVPPVVVALFEITGGVLEVVGGGSEVERGVWIGPKLCPRSRPSHRRQHLVSIHVPNYCHLLHLQLYVY